MARPMESVRIRATGVAVTVAFNDVPLTGDDSGEGVALAMGLNLWWRDKANEVRVEVRPVETQGPRAYPAPERPPSVFVLVETPDASAPPLAALEWSFPRDRPFAPRRWTIPVDAPTPAPTRLWLDAEPLPSLHDQDRAEALRLGTRLHEAFAARKLDEVMALLDARFDDYARAMDVVPAVMKARARQTYGRYLDDPTWKPAPIPVGKATLRPCAEGRLFVLEREGAPWIVTAPGYAGDPAMGLHVMVGKVRGEWAVLR